VLLGTQHPEFWGARSAGASLPGCEGSPRPPQPHLARAHSAGGSHGVTPSPRWERRDRQPYVNRSRPSYITLARSSERRVRFPPPPSREAQQSHRVAGFFFVLVFFMCPQCAPRASLAQSGARLGLGRSNSCTARSLASGDRLAYLMVISILGVASGATFGSCSPSWWNSVEASRQPARELRRMPGLRKGADEDSGT
jgi:hypothetical protein